MLLYIIQTNFVDLAIVLFLYIFLLTNKTFAKTTLNKFIASAVIVNILIVADSTDYWCAAQSRPMLLRYITSATGYTFRVVPILLFMLIAIHLNKKMTVILSIPALANGLLAYGSVFNKLMFYFDEKNKFHRGVLGFFPFLVSAFYMLMLLIGSIRKYRMGGDEFTILCPKANTHSIEKMMKLIYDETYKKGYQIAWGMAMYKPDMDFEKACSLSDARMYENKFMTKNML